MPKLDAADTGRLLAGLDDLYALGPLGDFPERALAVASELVRCEMASYNEIDLRTGGFKVVADPLPPKADELNAAFAQFAHQHPVIEHVRRTGDPRALTISDFVRPNQFRRCELYGEMFRHVGTEEQLSATFTAVPGQVILAVALGRTRPFTDRDREVLDALRPHLARAYRNALAYEAALVQRSMSSDADLSRVRLSRLTDRQLELLALIAAGRSNAQAALTLGLSVGTVKKHLEHIFARLGVDSRLGAARVYLDGVAPRSVWWSVDGVASALKPVGGEPYHP